MAGPVCLLFISCWGSYLIPCAVFQRTNVRFLPFRERTRDSVEWLIDGDVVAHDRRAVAQDIAIGHHVASVRCGAAEARADINVISTVPPAILENPLAPAWRILPVTVTGRPATSDESQNASRMERQPAKSRKRSPRRGHEARSLFGAETLAKVRDVVEIPNPVPFTGVKVQRVHVTHYRSGFNVESLLESAREELAIDKPEQFKIFLLGAMAGLRRNEIDKLPWSAFRWDEGVIHIQVTEYFRPKSRASENGIPVDPELMEIFRGYHARRRGEFVIESDSAPDNGKPYEHYRCQREFVELIGWLRSKGVVSRTPLHTLRKEFGSQINARFGLVAAQRMLRHAQVAVTAAHYVEIKQRPVFGFGHLLTKDGRTIIPIDGSLTPSKLSAQQKA
jgi:integrase